MEDYAKIVADYEAKRNDRAKYCSLTRIVPATLAVAAELPREIALNYSLYLGYGRNAWHNTWINRYYPGTVSFFDSELKDKAEKERVQGSQFRLSARRCLLLRLKSTQIAILVINSKSRTFYDALLNEALPFRIEGFWSSDLLRQEDSLLIFSMSGWRPDLLPKEKRTQVANLNGPGRPFKWVCSDPSPLDEDFEYFSRELMRRLLSLRVGQP